MLHPGVDQYKVLVYLRQPHSVRVLLGEEFSWVVIRTRNLRLSLGFLLPHSHRLFMGLNLTQSEEETHRLRKRPEGGQGLF